MFEKWSWCDFIAGWTGGVFGLAIGHPLDTVKVRQQTAVGKSGILHISLATIKHEGLHGLYKGLSYPLLSAGLYNSVFFGVYGNVLRHTQKLNTYEDRRMCCEGPPAGKHWHRDVFIAGCLAGVATVLYSCPIEVIKIKLQNQTGFDRISAISETHYNGPWHALTSIYKCHGLRKGLYRGTVCMLWRDVPTFGVYTLSYEHILCMFKEEQDRSTNTSVLSQIVAGGIAGILSWILVVPFDVIKSRIQADNFYNPTYNGIIDCAKKCLAEGGVKLLFRGTILMTIRAFVLNAATFVGYEYVIEQC